MKVFAKAIVVLLCAAAVALAQPAITPNGMVNAASYIQAGLPNGDVAQGSIFAIFGKNMGPETPASATWPLPTIQGLGGATVNVEDSGGVSHSVILLFVSAGQINAVLPSAVAVGQASLTVTYNGQTSASQTFKVVARSVGLFARNAGGSGPGIVLQYHGSNPTPTLNDISNSAYPGDVAVLWGTGLGPITTDETQPPPQTNMGQVAYVWVGGQQVTNVAYEGRSTFAGEDQINFTIPSNITGCYVPVFVQIGTVVSNTVSMSIMPNGGMCSDSLSGYGSLTSAYLQAHGLKQGSVTLSRTAVEMPSPLPTTTTDAASGVFDSYDWAQLAESRGIGVSVYGACTVFTFSGSSATTTDPIAPTYLDAGALSLVGPDGVTKPIPSASKGLYTAQLGSSTTSLYLSAGKYTLTGAGGADVGAFTSSLTLPAPFTWTNMDALPVMGALSVVTRAKGVEVNWTGGTGNVVIEGYSAITTPQNAGAIFICYAQASAGSFTVEPGVLMALPESAESEGIPMGALMVSNTPASADFNPNPPSGLDAGRFAASFAFMKMVLYN